MRTTGATRLPGGIVIADVTLMRNTRAILRDVTWRVEAQEQAAILGPNGSGKSTLARVLLGYLWPTRGSVSVAGRVFGETDLNQLRQTVRLVQSTSPFEVDPNLSVRDVVLTGFEGTLGLYTHRTEARDGVHAGEHDDAIDAMIRRVGLGRVADNIYGHLSTGERLRVQLARALIVKPQVMILDEPTAGLDIRGREELLGVLDDLHAHPDAPAMVMVTHHAEELPRNTSNVLLLDQGQVARTGTPAHVLQADVLSRVYGCAIDVHTADGRYYLHARAKRW